jgi:Mg2+-importing ATPase
MAVARAGVVGFVRAIRSQMATISIALMVGGIELTVDFNAKNPITSLRSEWILLALKRLGHVVGFMGDGINDAPALHAADVGISVDGAVDVARAAADLILLEHDLSVVREAVVGGRQTVQNVSKYVLMGSSSNFGNMFSMAGAALFLPFLPMLPIQILPNNLLYDVSEIAIPFDGVDPEAIASPVKWDGVVTLPNRGVTNPRRLIHQAAAAASRHVCIADALKARCVLAEVRWRWT